MANDDREIVDTKVDIGVLKTQVSMLINLCDRLDKIIEKMSNYQEKMIEQIYSDMRKREEEKDADVRELHSRISTISREMTDKVEATERRIMDEIQALRKAIVEHNRIEEGELRKILEWKWMAGGAIVVIAWLLSHIKFDTIAKLF